MCNFAFYRTWTLLKIWHFNTRCYDSLWRAITMASHLAGSFWKASYLHHQVYFSLMCLQCWAALLHGSTSLPLLTSLPVVSQHCGTDLWPVPCWLCLLTAVLCTTLFNLDLYLVCSLTNGVSLSLSFFLSHASSLYVLPHLHLHAHIIIS